MKKKINKETKPIEDVVPIKETPKKKSPSPKESRFLKVNEPTIPHPASILSKKPFLVCCPNCNAYVETLNNYMVVCPSCIFKIEIDSDTLVDEEEQEIMLASIEKDYLLENQLIKLN